MTRSEAVEAMARGMERESWSLSVAIVSGKVFTSHDMAIRRAQAALQALEEGGMVVVPREALQPFLDAVADADEDTVSDSSAAWESAMAMAVTFGDFRRLARSGGSAQDHAQSTTVAPPSGLAGQPKPNGANP